MLLRAFLIGLMALSCPFIAEGAEAPVLRVLFFSKSATFEHSVIKRHAGQPSWAEQVLTELGAKHGIAFTFSKDGSTISRDYLAQFDVLFFFTNGVITSEPPNIDGQPPLTEEGLQAIYDAVAAGKGFVGCHSTSDTFHTGEGPRTRSQFEPGRWVNHGAAAHPWVKFVGGEFIRHGKQQIAEMRRVSASFPGLSETPGSVRLHEEWYSLKDFTPDLHVIHVLETAGMEGVEYQRPAFPYTWARRHGEGRVFYTALGHREDVWAAEYFQSIILAGLNWAGRRAEAELPPNLDDVAPEHATIPTPDQRN